MTNEITAYNNPNAPEHRRWIAYVVLSNGQLWGVYATASTEGAAKEKIGNLWESEKAKIKPLGNEAHTVEMPTEWGDKREHHLAGLVWIINKATREKKRVSPQIAEGLLAFGEWERGGPRSK